MRIVEVFLPLRFPNGDCVPGSIFDIVKEELVARFGGVTVHSRVPAEGVWQRADRTETDPIIIFEIMTSSLDKEWWRDFRKRMEDLFHQEEVTIHALHATKI